MRPLPSPRNARTRSAAAGSRDAIRGGLDRQLGGPMVAPDGHLNAALAEAGELLPYLGEALHGARRDCQLEPRPIARPQRILGDRLGGVRGEPTGPLEGAGRPSRGRRDAHPHAERPFRSARLLFAARADEETGGLNEITVGPHLIEGALRHDDRELRLERHRQLDEIERVGGQLVTQRDLGDQLLGADAKMVSDQASNVRFHEFLHAPPSRVRYARVRARSEPRSATCAGAPSLPTCARRGLPKENRAMATDDADDLVTFRDVRVIRSTAPALLCRIGNRSVWLPRWHVSGKLWCAGDRGKLLIRRWLARERLLIDLHGAPIACPVVAISRPRLPVRLRLVRSDRHVHHIK